MYTGFGEAGDKSHGAWVLSSDGYVGNGPATLRSPSDPPYIPTRWAPHMDRTQDGSSRKYFTIYEMTRVPYIPAGQTDFSGGELQQLIAEGRGQDIWPNGQGPFHASYSGGVSPYGVLYQGDFHEFFTDQDFIAAMSDFSTGKRPETYAGSTPYGVIGGAVVNIFDIPSGPAVAPSASPWNQQGELQSVMGMVDPIDAADLYASQVAAGLVHPYVAPSTGSGSNVDTTDAVGPGTNQLWQPGEEVVSPGGSGAAIQSQASSVPVWAWAALAVGIYALIKR